jgi:hypothetical protein
VFPCTSPVDDHDPRLCLTPFCVQARGLPPRTFREDQLKRRRSPQVAAASPSPALAVAQGRDGGLAFSLTSPDYSPTFGLVRAGSRALARFYSLWGFRVASA